MAYGSLSVTSSSILLRLCYPLSLSPLAFADLSGSSDCDNEPILSANVQDSEEKSCLVTPPIQHAASQTHHGTFALWQIILTAGDIDGFSFSQGVASAFSHSNRAHQSENSPGKNLFLTDICCHCNTVADCRRWALGTLGCECGISPAEIIFSL